MSGIEQYFGEGFDCACGRHHRTAFSNFELSHGAIGKLPQILKKLGFSKPYLLSDTHTYEAAGRQTEAALKAAGIPFVTHVLKSPETGNLTPDETAFGSAALGLAMDVSCDIVVSVGSGTINDTGRLLSFLTGREFILVMTAPSMDGLVSGVAPLIYNDLKTTFPAHAPLALIADLDVLVKAPDIMIAAGAGDIIGKYNCLNDWKLSRIINDEYYCETIAGIMGEAVRRTSDSVAGLAAHEEGAIWNLTEALVFSGIAMDFSGNSRPASGAEHHMAHYWEMQSLFEKRHANLHGTEVGIGAVIALSVYQVLAEMEKPDFEALKRGAYDRMPYEAWEKEIRRCYQAGAPAVIELEKTAKKNDPEALVKRLERIEAHWEQIQALAKSAPKPEEIDGLLTTLHGAKRPGEVGISRDKVHDALMYAKELRNRYTVLQLMWDLGKLPEIADLMTDRYCS